MKKENYETHELVVCMWKREKEREREKEKADVRKLCAKEPASPRSPAPRPPRRLIKWQVCVAGVAPRVTDARPRPATWGRAGPNSLTPWQAFRQDPSQAYYVRW